MFTIKEFKAIGERRNYGYTNCANKMAAVVSDVDSLMRTIEKIAEHLGMSVETVLEQVQRLED